jgi:hypothetical protein
MTMIDHNVAIETIQSEPDAKLVVGKITLDEMRHVWSCFWEVGREHASLRVYISRPDQLNRNTKWELDGVALQRISIHKRKDYKDIRNVIATTIEKDVRGTDISEEGERRKAALPLTCSK